MEIAPEVIELEQLAARVGVSFPAALKKAGLAHTTYPRWKNEGREPSTRTIRKLRAAIAELAEERAA